MSSGLPLQIALVGQGVLGCVLFGPFCRPVIEDFGDLAATRIEVSRPGHKERAREADSDPVHTATASAP